MQDDKQFTDEPEQVHIILVLKTDQKNKQSIVNLQKTTRLNKHHHKVQKHRKIIMSKPTFLLDQLGKINQ